MRETSLNCSIQAPQLAVVEQDYAHSGGVELERHRRSARLTEGGDLGEKDHTGKERRIAGERQHMGRMNRSDHMHTGRGAHPGADAGAVHPGIVVRGMLKLMRDCAARRHRQEGNDGEDNRPDDAMNAGTTHRQSTQTWRAC